MESCAIRPLRRSPLLRRDASKRHMDTRTKIQRQSAPLSPDARVLAGYFDPLLAEHAARIHAEKLAAAGPLAVVVLDPPEPILAWEARAALVAALADVDLVLAAAPRVDTHLEEHDLATRARFLAHVRDRHLQHR